MRQLILDQFLPLTTEMNSRVNMKLETNSSSHKLQSAVEKGLAFTLRLSGALKLSYFWEFY